MCHRSVTAAVEREGLTAEGCWWWQGKSPSLFTASSDPENQQQLLLCLLRAGGSGDAQQLWERVSPFQGLLGSSLQPS